MTRMSNLIDLAILILNAESRTFKDNALTGHPLLGWVVIEFTYDYDGGSDCWYTEHRTGVCTLRDWLNGKAVEAHCVGNRSYNFKFSKIMDADEISCAAAKAAHEKKVAAHMAAAREYAEAQRAEAAKAKLLLEIAVSKFTGKHVTSKKASGKVERVMRSKFGNSIVALVAGKWLCVDNLTLA